MKIFPVFRVKDYITMYRKKTFQIRLTVSTSMFPARYALDASSAVSRRESHFSSSLAFVCVKQADSSLR